MPFDLAEGPLFRAKMYKLGARGARASSSCPTTSSGTAWSFDLLYERDGRALRRVQRGEAVAAGAAAGELRRLRRLAARVHAGARARPAGDALEEAPRRRARAARVADRLSASARGLGAGRDRVAACAARGGRADPCSWAERRGHAVHGAAGALLRAAGAVERAARFDRRDTGPRPQPPGGRERHGILRERHAVAPGRRPPAAVHRALAARARAGPRRLRGRGRPLRAPGARAAGSARCQPLADLPDLLLVPGRAWTFARLGEPAARPHSCLPAGAGAGFEPLVRRAPGRSARWPELRARSLHRRDCPDDQRALPDAAAGRAGQPPGGGRRPAALGDGGARAGGGLERHPRRLSARSARRGAGGRAGAPHARSHGDRLRQRDDLPRRARRAGQPVGPLPASARRGAGDAGGDRARALARHGRLHAGGVEGRRHLRSSRSGLSARAPGADGRRLADEGGHRLARRCGFARFCAGGDAGARGGRLRDRG